MKTLLPNVNTSEGCFEIGVTISNPVFTEDAINKRKQERELGNDSNLLIVFYVQIMPDDFVMQLHRF
ncbi:hypothetical protein CI692_20830 [Escherichia coli]|uniref:cell division inhibition protein DicB n=1 Tax=Escherichia coli TaxID=562 RepID=UPI000B959B9A|nr:cell division inhibition protein DicB [Escherichia coli]OYI61830.1 hypothetical protein CI692_20830 [Escherichia coli]TNK00381.1 hypothetical protein CI690_000530 [Escherichia coli]